MSEGWGTEVRKMREMQRRRWMGVQVKVQERGGRRQQGGGRVHFLGGGEGGRRGAVHCGGRNCLRPV